jgi:hypothetical protein
MRWWWIRGWCGQHEATVVAAASGVEFGFHGFGGFVTGGYGVVRGAAVGAAADDGEVAVVRPEDNEEGRSR